MTTSPRTLVLVAGASGSGKSRLALMAGRPLVRLDDFYRDGDEPDVPHTIVDWDDVRSWRLDAAVQGLRTLCRDGVATVPVYDIAANAAVGQHRVELDDDGCVVAEGVFAPDVLAPARAGVCTCSRSGWTARAPSPSCCGWCATCASAARRRWCWCVAAWSGGGRSRACGDGPWAWGSSHSVCAPPSPGWLGRVETSGRRAPATVPERAAAGVTSHRRPCTPDAGARPTGSASAGASSQPGRHDPSEQLTAVGRDGAELDGAVVPLLREVVVVALEGPSRDVHPGGEHVKLLMLTSLTRCDQSVPRWGQRGGSIRITGPRYPPASGNRLDAGPVDRA